MVGFWNHVHESLHGAVTLWYHERVRPDFVVLRMNRDFQHY